MKRNLLIFWALFWIVARVAAQTPAFKRSGTNLPFATGLESNHVFNVDRGGGLPPANVPYGVLRGKVGVDLDLKHSSGALDVGPVNAFQNKRMLARLFNRQKVTLAFLGDSTGVDVQPCVEDSLLPFMGRVGAAVVSTRWYGGAMMNLAGAGANYYQSAGMNGVFWGKFCTLGNGGSVATGFPLSNNIPANIVGCAWYQNAAFGSMVLAMQDDVGDWYDIATLAGTGGAGLTLVTTNIDLGGLTAVQSLRVTSTGTNIPVALKIFNTTSGLGFNTASMDTPGVSPIGYMINAGSNNVAKFFQWLSPDTIFYKAERITTATNELPWFDTLISNAVPLCDVVYIAYHTNAQDGWAITNRDFMASHARRFNRAFVDTYAASLPFRSSSSNSLYSADGVHLANSGYAVLHSRVPSQMGFGAAELLAMNIPFLPPSISIPGTNDTSKAKLVGGNNFQGPQTFDGWFDLKGTYNGNPAIGLWNSAGDQKHNLQRFGNHFLITDSTAAYASIFSISNLSGQSLIEAPYRLGVLGKARPMEYHGTNFIQCSNLPPAAPFRAGDAFTWNSNGVVYLITSGIGITWTATNKLAP